MLGKRIRVTAPTVTTDKQAAMRNNVRNGDASKAIRKATLPLVLAAFAVAGCKMQPTTTSAENDRLEPGLQGQSLPEDNPGSILAQPYSKGVRVVGHDPIRGRDSNVQMTWVDHCAYVSSTGGPFPLIGTGTGDTTLTGVAVIDVRDPKNPKTVSLLRDRGSIAALETMHAIAAPGRKILAAGAYSNGKHGPSPENPAWLNIYDVSDCAIPKLMAEFEWPENVHTVRISPDGKRIYGTVTSPFDGGIQILDVSNLARPRYLGKFAATRSDGETFVFGPHEVSISPDERRIYAAVNDSKLGDLNQDVPFLPPTRQSLGPNGGGVYIFDNSDIVAGRAEPKLRLIGTVPHGGWHSVVPANINGVPHLVGGAELGPCPGTWPKIMNIADETKPAIVGEFKLAMNHAEHCPPPRGIETGPMGFIAAAPGTAALHFNDVDSATSTRLGLFQFLWAGLRIVDLKDPAKPLEVAYFKPGDACGGHVRYMPETGHIWATCGQSGFYVLELTPSVLAALR
jgi:hypothetical protein